MVFCSKPELIKQNNEHMRSLHNSGTSSMKIFYLVGINVNFIALREIKFDKHFDYRFTYNYYCQNWSKRIKIKLEQIIFTPCCIKCSSMW
jgi:hypothetical protein